MNRFSDGRAARRPDREDPDEELIDLLKALGATREDAAAEYRAALEKLNRLTNWQDKVAGHLADKG